MTLAGFFAHSRAADAPTRERILPPERKRKSKGKTASSLTRGQKINRQPAVPARENKPLTFREHRRFQYSFRFFKANYYESVDTFLKTGATMPAATRNTSSDLVGKADGCNSNA